MFAYLFRRALTLFLVLLGLAILIFVIAVQKYVIAGMTAGSLKG